MSNVFSVIKVDTSIVRFYEKIQDEVKTVPAFNEMLFYTGSPDAEILVISEAPTRPNGPDDHTLFHSVTEKRNEKSIDEIASFLRTYPFKEEERNHLYQVYVEDILHFCKYPMEEIGFTDLCKKPLELIGEGVDLNEIWSNKRYSYKSIIRAQIRLINPEIVVCNKKNVSELISRMYLGKDGYSGDSWPERTCATVKSEGMKIVYSTMAHKQMSLLGRKRLSKEIQRIYLKMERLKYGIKMLWR